jgi:uncharacterized surface protein with fasciclin (FAS1) repeats
MKIIKSMFVLALFGTMSSLQAQGGQSASMEVKTDEVVRATVQTTPTIVGVASSNEVFSTLVTAVKSADLVETLNGAGPFTVFAPTNEAFAKLPEGTVESLLELENKESLKNVLTYHVVAGKFMAADVVKAIQSNNNAFAVKTANGQSLTLSLVDGAVMVTDANGNSSKVTATDVGTSNGVIHVIDTVLLPK